MTTYYCTLFDSYYLDKGIAMAQSLSEYATDYTLYIYAFDSKAYDILCDYKIPNTKIVLFENIITDELKQIRTERSRAEFCWTCTPFIIEYTIEKYAVDICTYIDADLYFYDNPEQLIQEMIDNNCAVQIVEHRFPNYSLYKRIEKMSGKFCVEFNTFLNNNEGSVVLKWWKEQCFSCCTSDWKKGSFGDQKYLDYWQEKFTGIDILQNHGGGVAPWNICRYQFLNKNNNNILFMDKKKRKKYNLVFFHFHEVCFISDSEATINVYQRPGKVDNELVDVIYKPYIRKLILIRKLLYDRYKFEMPIKKQEKIFAWFRDESLSFVDKVKKIMFIPQEIYQKECMARKDIIRIED